MRILSVIIIWIIFVGGLGLYMNRRAAAPKPVAPIQTAEAKETYALEIMITFTVEPDPFALQTDDAAPPALLVRLADQEILRKTERLEGGVPIAIDPLPGLTVGKNEIYFEASPPLNAFSRSQAVRVRLLKNNLPLTDRTFWSEPGGKVTGVFPFDITESEHEGPEHQHG